jgi:outer membrane protein OmpA-like peptidoglycan-associated protein
MKIVKLFLISFILGVGISVFFGCAKKIPQAELDAAKEALERAKKIGADKLEEYKIAEKHYNDALTLVQAKKYDDARVKAIVSKEFAEAAIKKWEELMRRPPEERVEIVEEEPEFRRPNLPRLKGVKEEDIAGLSTLGRGYILKGLKKVYFDFDSYSLREDAREAIKENFNIIKPILDENPEAAILIEGHCDERGTNEYNLELGWKRANAVKRYLIMLGIPEDRIQTVSFGEEFPEAPCPPPQCNDESKWRLNRRAVFVITTKE